MKKIKKHPKAIKGKFSIASPNEDIYLSKEKLTVFQDKKKLKTKGDLFLELLPLCNFSIKTENLKDKFLFFSIDDIKLQIDRSTKTDWFVTNISNEFKSKKYSTILKAKSTKSYIEFPKVDNISSCNFHIINFPEFIGRVIRHNENNTSAGRLELSDRNWVIQIDNTLNTKKNIDTLKKSGGYAITHVGRLEKRDKKLYSSEEAREISTKLMYFLSFANGIWVNPTLFSGFSKNRKEIWQGWFMHHSHPWKNVSFSWYEPLHATKILPSAFEGYIKVIEDSKWADIMKQVIYWYVQTNISNVDSGIILGQTALELLAWNYLVIDKNILSRRKFKNNSTADNLRLLLQEINIPIAIPNTNIQLKSFSKPGEDGPSLITRVRNNLIHPEKNIRNIPFFYVKSLQQWYIELIPLRLFNYNGEYSNRLRSEAWAGQVEFVPWK